jgi:hypothetical protein
VAISKFKCGQRHWIGTIGTGFTGTGAASGKCSTGHERPDEQHGCEFSGDEWKLYEFGSGWTDYI